MAKASRLRKTGEMIWLSFFLLIGGSLFSQEITVTASVSANPVIANEPFQITVTVENSQGNVQMTQVEGLEFLYGPSQSQSYSNVNGKKTSQFVYSWTFKAKAEGNVVIPSIAVRTSKGTMKTEPIDLKVTKAGGQSNAAIDKDFMTVIEVSKKQVYLGEPIVVEYKIFNRYNGFSPDTHNITEIDGFWTETKTDHQPAWTNEVVNGKRYQVATMRIDVLFPQETGTFELKGFEMTGFVRTNFFSRNEISATSKPVKIEVLPLPSGKPENFLGTFSQLSMEVTPSRTQLSTNEALDFDVVFSGKGNMRLLSDIKPNWPVDFEVYDPDIDEKISVNEAGVSGKKTMRYVIIPRSEGTYTIPGFAYSYFDSKQKKYVALTSEPVTLNVKKGTGSSDGNYSFNSKSDVQMINQDIRYIRRDVGILFAPETRFFGSPLFYLLFGIPYLAFGAAYLVYRKRKQEAGNMALTRQRKAGSFMKKWLKEASAEVGNPSNFYNALGRGLEQYLIDKLSFERGSMRKGSIKAALEPKFGDDITNQFISLWERCEMARFAPASSADAATDLELANELIKKMEAR